MVATAARVGTGNDLALTLDYATKTKNAYPINLVTYEIVCSVYKDPAKGALVKAFLTHFASVRVQKGLEKPRLRPAAGRSRHQGPAAIAAIG
jgi:phosphate transport system substrate-binding protein